MFRLESTIRALTARKRFLETEISELQGLLDGSWDSAKERVLAERAKAKIAMRIGELEEELIRAIEAIRWSENDAQSGVAEREQEATEELEAARNKKVDLEAQIAELTRQLGS